MEYIKSYFRAIAYMVMAIVFAFSSFYLFINIFHTLELSKKVDINVNDSVVIKDYYQKIENIDNNIKNFNPNSYHGTEVPATKMIVIQGNLKQCSSILKNTYLESLKDKKSIDIKDVYELRNSYENSILSECIINNLYWTSSLSENGINSSKLLANQELINFYISTLKNNTSYLKKDLLNNSSYYFNTSTASSGVKDNVRDGFYETLSAYKNAVNYVEYISKWFNTEVRGGM